MGFCTTARLPNSNGSTRRLLPQNPTMIEGVNHE
jgi:hypothetical protein